MVFGSNSIVTPANHKTSPSDVCASWQVIGAPIRLSTCSYQSGGSGYYTYENHGTVAAAICWTVAFQTAGKMPSDGCNSNTAAGHIASGSCASCGSSNGGAKSITLTKYEPK